MRIVRLQVRGVEWTETQLDGFIARWRRVRDERRWTVAEMASALGCSAERVRRIEKGHEAPAGALVLRFAELERSRRDRSLEWVPQEDRVV